MKECTGNKVFKGKKVPGGQRDQGHGVVLHDQGEGNQPTILEVGVANYLKFRCEP